MKFTKSLSLFLLMISLTLVFIVGCSTDSDENVEKNNEKDEENLTEVGSMPIVKEPITLNFFAGNGPTSNDDWNDVLIFNEYEEMTNIDVEWDMVPQASLDEKKEFGDCRRGLT